MSKLPKRLSKAQRSVLLDLLRAVNSEEIGSVREAAEFLDEHAPQWLLDWPIWSAGENMPGYMPDSPYRLFLTERAARGYCRELEREGGGRDYVSDYMPVTVREVLA